MHNSRHGSTYTREMQQEYKETGEEIGKEKIGKKDSKKKEWKERPMPLGKARQERREEKEDSEDHATSVEGMVTVHDSAPTRAKEKEERKEIQDPDHSGEEKEVSRGSQEDKDTGKETDERDQ